MARSEDYPGKPTGLGKPVAGMRGIRLPQVPTSGASLGRPQDAPAAVETDAGQLTKKAPAEQLKYIDIEAIIQSPYQPRIVFDVVSIEELANSIATIGLVKPLLVRPIGEGKYELVGGERRWRAHKLIDRKTVQCVVRKMDDQTAQIIALTDNEQENLTDFERGLGFWKVMDDAGESSRRGVARRLGITHTTVIRCMQFMELPAWAVDMLKQKPAMITLNYVSKFVAFCKEHEGVARPVIEQLFEGKISQEKALRMIAQEVARGRKDTPLQSQTYKIEGFGTLKTDGRKIELKCDSSVDMTEISKKFIEFLKSL